MLKSFSLKRLFGLSLAWVLAFSFTGVPARADVPRPPRPTPRENPQPQLQITVDPAAKVAHLRLPRSVLQELTPQARPRADSGISPARTVVAGLALASALAVSGLFLARGWFGRGRSAIIAITLVGVLGVLTTVSLADLAVPGHPRSPQWHRLPGPPALENVGMPVVIEMVEDGSIELTLPADQAAKVAQLPTTRPAVGNSK